MLSYVLLPLLLLSELESRIIVKVTLMRGKEAFPISPYGPHVPAWRLLTAAIHHHFPDAVTAPAPMVANTDTRHFHDLVDKVYRFFPFILNKNDTATIHAPNERLSTQNFINAVKFYHTLIVAAGNFADDE
ncbi:hypothetical protein Pmani_006385 [Petrolisthes manimaculis]|uniref:N-acyl-aliphatic-L-amino acid amidohydrolase n=1 Tax=Petrolisthes manimaculis TaxID=1843537 RepID=A0AAE1QAE2_9EUCA|nr:hypothetical protein Pmani_006385 [Petrolisthes manimaculis]